MPKLTEKEKSSVVRRLLREGGPSYAEELGIDLSRNTPSPLFRWFCASLLFSARISAAKASAAAAALSDAGWTTAAKMQKSTWKQRVRVLNRSGYARYDESTARMLGESCALMLRKYGGDLRKLRAAAERDPERERRLLKEFKGIGDLGADIFFREVQQVWPELYPFADKKSLKAAKKLHIGKTAEELAQLVPKRRFAALIAVLVRTDLENRYAVIEEPLA